MGTLRIIAGELRGRRIEVPRGATVRPTADRVREALFSILGEAVVDARVLDAYSGSGALGFEALSRGARSVVYLEAQRAVVDGIRRNAERLGRAECCTVVHGPVLERLGRLPGDARGPFDLIFADPPYRSGETGRFLPAAAAHLAAGGTLVIERDREAATALDPPGGLSHVRTARYGRTCLDLYRSEAANRSS